MPFVKLDCGILRSTIWELDAETCKVWITLLAMAGPSGLVECNSPGVAHEARLPVDRVEASLSILSAPDARSRTKDSDGRRIERTDEGYLILNYSKYREKDYSTPRVQAFRKRDETVGNGVKRDETPFSDKHKHMHKQKDNKDSCSAASAELPVPQELVGLVLYEVDEKLKSAWPKLFPAMKLAHPGVDVAAEVRKAHAWEIGNPSRVKKLRGKFLTGWMGRAQDKAGPSRTFAAPSAAPPTREWKLGEND